MPMRYPWDLLRWRFVAAFHIAWWFLRGAPMKDQPAKSRWENTRWAWQLWKIEIMFRHEKGKYVSFDKVMEELSARID